MKSLWLVPPKGQPIAVAKTPMVVGRVAGSDIVVAHSSVSRRHAVLERAGEDWQVADQNSANGTWIDGQRVIRAVLRGGQALRFGAVGFEVSFDEPGRAAAPAPRAAAPAPEARRAEPLPAAAAPPAASPSTLPSLSRPQAAELLGVAVGATADEVRRQYQKIYNDYQIRLTNAPTASLKRMYQKSVQELKAAVEVLAPGLLDGERG